MNKDFFKIFDELSVIYNLGKVQKKPIKIIGGLLHEMWKITTEKGEYAVKILNSEIMKRKEAYDNFVFSENFSNIAKNANIPSISAISTKGEYLVKIGNKYCMLFPWFEGNTLSTLPSGTDFCYTIGNIIAQIHNLKINYIQSKTYEEMVFNSNDLTLLESRYVGISEKIVELQEKYNENLSIFNSDIVISHRDIDQKNVLWDNKNNAMIIDWEASGPINPMIELLTAGLYWGGIISGEVREDSFKAIISGYLELRPIDYANIKSYLYGCIGFIDWLIYNLNRGNKIEISIEEKTIADIEIIKTIEVINNFCYNFDIYLKWVLETKNS